MIDSCYRSQYEFCFFWLVLAWSAHEKHLGLYVLLISNLVKGFCCNNNINKISEKFQMGTVTKYHIYQYAKLSPVK